MNFKTIMGNLLDGHKLSQSEAYQLMSGIGEGIFNESQNTALIIALSSRDITLEEIIGFRTALLDLSIPAELTNYDAIDLCGTGGDEKNTFNISTLASFVVAAAGYKVAKHGNYGVSSISGSSNVLESIGYRFSSDTAKLASELDELNLCFLHAPLFHPALKNVSGIRKQLGLKTIFNTLGPLVNPARTRKQLVGVYNLKLARLYHYLLQHDDKEYAVVHSVDGYDEISLTAGVQCFSSHGEYMLSPDELGMDLLVSRDLHGGETVEEARDIFLKVIDNRGSTAQTNVVIANAAMAIRCFEKDASLKECIDMARTTLVSGKAFRLLKKLIQKQ